MKFVRTKKATWQRLSAPCCKFPTMLLVFATGLLFIFTCSLTIFWSSESWRLEREVQESSKKGTNHHLQSFLDNSLNTSNSKIQALQATDGKNNSFLLTPPRRKPLAASKYRLLHVGKAGGGTVEDRTKRVWKLGIKICHPNLCKGYFDNGDNDGTIPATLLTIRDPVDRLESAFYWRISLDCPPESTAESCTPTKNIPLDERQILFEIYKQNVSDLGESFCSNNHDDNKAARAEEAARRIPKIGHLSSRLSGDWLPPQWAQFSHRIFPIVLERGFDLTSQIDAAIEWLHKVDPVDSENDFIKRRDYVYQRTMMINNNNNVDENEETNELSKAAADRLAKARHSSSSVAASAGRASRIPLSNLGAECLRDSYYADDYQILKQLRDQSCKTPTCREAIQSILNRRQIL